ncbi:unnamed protein product [Lactuca saligna]|uniref:Uncharacterized protein n=1 Tax=Lactuca saligna TaxID=75948 RepID=A0AA35Z1F1_LACSI|nr:unnamed protein product [Lactuca saligna]
MLTLDILPLGLSIASSSSACSQEAVKALINTTLKEHAENLEKVNKVVEDSAATCKEATKKVNKLINDDWSFMSAFQRSFDSNTTKSYEVISRLGSSLHTEKEKLKEVRTGLQIDNVELNSSITSKIVKLQDDLATESTIMDALTLKIEKLKVLNVKLENAEKKINELLSERAVVTSYVSAVNMLLSDLF